MANKRTRHGLHRLTVAIKTRDLRALDRRCAGSKALIQWRVELIDALGGESAITPQKRVLIDAIVRGKLFLDCLDSWLVQQRSVVNSRKKSILPALRERTAMVESLARLLSLLGLERQERRVPTLAQYIRERDEAARGAETEPVA